MKNERKLIEQLKLGSYAAFSSIYSMYAGRLYTYSLQYTKSVEEAEEIVQDVFVSLWNQRECIRQDETLQSLLFIMIKHHLINAYRIRVNQPVYEDYVDYVNLCSGEDTAYRLEYDDFRKEILRVLDMLPDTQRKVIRLSRLEQLSNKEIAARLSLSEQTVKNQLSIGLKRLKEKLEHTLWLFLFFFTN